MVVSDVKQFKDLEKENARFDKNDCRCLFDQIDYVIFEGVIKTGSVHRIIFTDIK